MDNIFGRFRKKEKPKTGDYEYFKDKHERHDIYEFSKELTEYIKGNDIKDVILIDRSARPAWVAVDEYWKTNYPDEKGPSIHFINPEVLEIDNFFKKEGIGHKERVKDLEELITGGVSPILERFNSKIRLLADEFVEKYKIDKDDPVLVFDTCSHTGETLQAVTNMLGAAGYDVRILTANDSDRVPTEKRLDRNTKMTSCYPFGKDSGVKKEDSLISSLDENADRKAVVTSRREIRKIVKGQGK